MGLARYCKNYMERPWWQETAEAHWMASVALGYGIGRKSEGRRLKRVTDLDIDSAAQPVSLKSQVGVLRRRVFRHICTHAQRRVKERELQMWHFGDAIGCRLLDHTVQIYLLHQRRLDYARSILVFIRKQLSSRAVVRRLANGSGCDQARALTLTVHPRRYCTSCTCLLAASRPLLCISAGNKHKANENKVAFVGSQMRQTR